MFICSVLNTLRRTSKWKSFTVRPRNGQEQVWFQLGNHVLQRVFAKVSQVQLKAGIRVANLINFSCTSLRLDL